MKFRFYALRYSLAAKHDLHVPEGGLANLLRGRMGATLLHADPDAYYRYFKPHNEHGPSGLVDRPRPFAFRTPEVVGRDISFGLHWFAAWEPWLENLFDDATFLEATAMELSLEPNGAAHTATVHFRTPTELKSGGEIVARPEFAVLAARARDRVSALRAFYGDGPIDMDFRGYNERAAHVSMTRCELRHVDIERHSKATGQTHPLGGFVGEVSYAGDLTEFLPWLRIAQWTGVGRQTAWGKGVIQVDA